VKNFIKQALIGGTLVILPIVIIIFFFRWVFLLVTQLIQPLTQYTIVQFGFPELVSNILVIALILFGCFAIGTLVSTSLGKWLHHHFDKYLIKLAPGYRMVKEIVTQVFGGSEGSPFSKGEVVRAKLFGEHCETSVTALVTSKHANGMVTIFVPTGPNPTSGNIYHIPNHLVVYYPEVKVETMMKSIIACGAGSDKLFTINE